MNKQNGGPGAGHEEFAGLSRDQIHSALFAQMVMQQSNLALMLLGKTPHPETGQPMRDLDAAKLFIDQLEMLEVKTKGNLNSQEAMLLKQSLMTLHLAFVEAVNAPETPPPAAKPATTPAKEDSPAAENKTAPAETTGAASEEETQKRFSKKYSA
jgi:hypothetical protein